MFTLLLLGSALAQETNTLTDEAGVRVQYKTVTEIEFDKLKIEGKLEGPDGIVTLETVHRPPVSLIRLRMAFDDEMAQSANEIR